MKLTAKELKLAETLNFTMKINSVDKPARINIAVAVGHLLQSERQGFNLDLFVCHATMNADEFKV